MRLPAHLTPPVGGPSFVRTVSSLAPGHLLQGARWGYRVADAVKGDETHTSAVFKARVIPHEDGPDTPQWATIKRASPGDKIASENLGREYRSYRLPGVASTTCFRQLYDVIDNLTLALEWLDSTLADVEYQPDTRTYANIKAVLKETLTSCAVLDCQEYVNTDLKPANILLSGVDTGCITAKVGDLGLGTQSQMRKINIATNRFIVVPDGYLHNAQPYAMRAPEVFLGQPCTRVSQVWAVGALLLCWIKPGILGAWDSPHPLINEAWCMAKIKRLFPGWQIPHPEQVERPTLKSAVESAVILSEDESGPKMIGFFVEETSKLKIPDQLRDLLSLMLVVDPRQRPSASAVLESKEFKAFQML